MLWIGHSYNYFASIIPYFYINSSINVQVQQAKKVKRRECIIFEADEFMNMLNMKLDYQKSSVGYLRETLEATDEVMRQIEIRLANRAK